jgi:reactive intermediate/imine deaminase
MPTTTGAQPGSELGRFYRATGLAGRVGFGSHPAVLLVDMQVHWNDPQRRLGADMGPAVDAIGELVDTARARDVPVVYVWSAWRADGGDAGRWIEKIPALSDITPDSDGARIHPRVAPRVGDPLVLKKGPSGFFHTPLDAVLRGLGVDTLLLAGASTSGCIRATAIDGLQHGYRTIVAADVVGDRAQGPHEANLLDIDAKYADVVPLGEVLDYLGRLAPEIGVRRAAADAPRPIPAGSLVTCGGDENGAGGGIAVGLPAAKHAVEAAGAPRPHAGAPYSQLVRYGDLLFSSGQIAADPVTATIVGADVAEQTAQVMRNLRTLLEAAGSSLEKIVHATVYLADLEDWPAMNRAYAAHVGATPPARAAVQVGLPTGVLVEIAVIAHV